MRSLFLIFIAVIVQDVVGLGMLLLLMPFCLSWLFVVVVVGVVAVASLIVGGAAVVVVLCGECYVIVFLLRP